MINRKLLQPTCIEFDVSECGISDKSRYYMKNELDCLQVLKTYMVLHIRRFAHSFQLSVYGDNKWSKAWAYYGSTAE